MKPKLGILGGGWLGSRAADFFRERYEVRVTSRSGALALDLDASPAYFPALAEVDILLIAAPLHRISGYRGLSQVLGDFKGQLYYCSSTGVYPATEGDFTEADAVDPELLAVEEFLKVHFPQVCLLRLGGLMGDERYLARFFKDRPLPQPGGTVNYIHYRDILEVLDVLFQGDYEGEIFNIVAPLHPRKNEVYYVQTGIRVEGEPFNRTVSSNKLIQKTGYRFRHPDPVCFPFIRSL